MMARKAHQRLSSNGDVAGSVSGLMPNSPRHSANAHGTPNPSLELWIASFMRIGRAPALDCGDGPQSEQDRCGGGFSNDSLAQQHGRHPRVIYNGES